jgi:hypothetical protein
MAVYNIQDFNFELSASGKNFSIVGWSKSLRVSPICFEVEVFFFSIRLFLSLPG